MNTPDIPPGKIPFIDVLTQSELDSDALASVACEVANVPKMAVSDMINRSPVTKHDAEGVLKILSQHTGITYTLENVDIPLLGECPTFLDVCALHSVSLPELAEQSGINSDVINRMIIDLPVFGGFAEKVLTALSVMTGQEYSLETVRVNRYVFIADQSEVARIMNQIELEHEACQRAIHGSALGTAQHQFITKRMENIAEGTKALDALIGKEATMDFLQQF